MTAPTLTALVDNLDSAITDAREIATAIAEHASRLAAIKDRLAALRTAGRPAKGLRSSDVEGQSLPPTQNRPQPRPATTSAKDPTAEPPMTGLAAGIRAQHRQRLPAVGSRTPNAKGGMGGLRSNMPAKAGG
jgi:hypothetical protein